MTGNTANEGGALYFAGGNALAKITGCNLESNSAATGGGIAGGGTLTLLYSSLYANTATYNGGGVWLAGGSVTLTNCTLGWNKAVKGGLEEQSTVDRTR